MYIRTQLFIDGTWIKSNSTELMDVINPATEEVIGRIPLSGAQDVDRAVDAARRAFPTWSGRPFADRLDLLQSLYKLFAKESEELSQRTTAEMGAATTFSRDFMTGLTLKVIARTIEIAWNYPYEQRTGETFFIREAFGVVGKITPGTIPLL